MDKRKSVIGPTTIGEGLTDGSNWLATRHGCEEVTVGRVSKAKAFSDYIKNNEFETMTFLAGKYFCDSTNFGNISVTQPTPENISVNRPTSENSSVT